MKATRQRWVMINTNKKMIKLKAHVCDATKAYNRMRNATPVNKDFKELMADCDASMQCLEDFLKSMNNKTVKRIKL